MYADQLTLDFSERFPRKPYCTDDPNFGLKIRGLDSALKCRHIQPNPPDLKFWLIYDIDWAGGAFAWQDALLPPPNWTATNRENGHAHIAYGVRVPIYTADPNHQKPLRLAAAIEQAYREALKADETYVGLITKNPVHPEWLVDWYTDHYYDLSELADAVTLPARLKPRSNNSKIEYGLHRNVTLFDKLRFWAYKSVLAFRLNGSTFEQWYRAVEAQAQKYNDFPTPLSLQETQHTAKSIAKWVWRNYVGRLSNEEFSKRQSVRGKRRAEQRRSATSEKITAAYTKITSEGKKPTQIAVAEIVGIRRELLSKEYKELWKQLKGQDRNV